MAQGNPLFDDRDVRFVLYDVLGADKLCELPYFADHSPQTFDLYLKAARDLARNEVFPSYKPMDEHPAHYQDGRVHTHPIMVELWPKIVELGVLNASRPAEVGGQQVPMVVHSAACAYLMAANLSAFGYAMLTTGSAHLIEAFGSPELKQKYMDRMYEGRWTGTMALTEPQAGSSLADVQTRATPTAEGHYLMSGSKVFISGGDQTITENIVHLALARIDGAPPGIKGVSLFAVPKLREAADGTLVDNDVSAAGAFHKLGWRGIPSIALNFGERGECHGYLVGEPHRGIPYMFQMMNEARINIGIHGIATASVAYREALEYARTRPQGRNAGTGASAPQVPIIAHADVRRMLLRQKAIVEGGLGLVLQTAQYQDLAHHAATAAERERALQLLDLLTPIAKTFPAEKGFEANTLAVQIHGGYGYTSEYLPEAWLRDQKLNSLHEGTTGIQSNDLLGRKVIKGGGATIALLREEIGASIAAAVDAGVDQLDCDALHRALDMATDLAGHLRELGARDIEAALRHAVDFMELTSIIVIAWMWIRQAAAAKRALAGGSGDEAFLRGKLAAAQYWFRTELPRVAQLAALCRSNEGSYADMRDEMW
jgi:butyryl-CoA dehydrogenase